MQRPSIASAIVELEDDNVISYVVGYFDFMPPLAIHWLLLSAGSNPARAGSFDVRSHFARRTEATGMVIRCQVPRV